MPKQHHHSHHMVWSGRACVGINYAPRGSFYLFIIYFVMNFMSACSRYKYVTSGEWMASVVDTRSVSWHWLDCVVPNCQLQRQRQIFVDYSHSRCSLQTWITFGNRRLLRCSYSHVGHTKYLHLFLKKWSSQKYHQHCRRRRLVIVHRLWRWLFCFCRLNEHTKGARLNSVWITIWLFEYKFKILLLVIRSNWNCCFVIFVNDKFGLLFYLHNNEIGNGQHDVWQ